MKDIKSAIQTFEVMVEETPIILFNDDYEMIKNSLEKQVSKQVISNGYVYFCPICKGSVWQIKYESEYCFRCGQKLHWT